MPPLIVNNPLPRALRRANANPPLNYYQNNNLRPALTRNKSRRNLFNRTSRGSLTATVPYIKKTTMFSNGSRPGNNINNSLPKSTLSATSDKTFGTSVVPPTSVENAYSRNNYNRKRNETKSSWSLWGGKRRKTRRSRK